jgi:ATP-dependent DNA helicase PIF1
MLNTLNKQQLFCFEDFQSGKNLVITGPGGCGKSYLIRCIRKYCEQEDHAIAVTALTGAAATLVGGQTLHGWAGIGLGEKSAGELHRSICRFKPHIAKRWRETKVLVIDEISMMDAELFNKLHVLAQLLRDNDLFFGGVQTIFCGDFAQLRPIGRNVKYCFESTIWKQYLCSNTHYLTENLRQNDIKFQNLLRRIRLGQVTEEDKQLLNSRLIVDEQEADINVDLSDGTKQIIKATLLYPKKADVNRINHNELNRLIDSGATKKDFHSIDSAQHKKNRLVASFTSTDCTILDKMCTAPSVLTLAVGAQVMLTKNKDVSQGLVNGSRGVVLGFDRGGLPTVIFDNGIQMAVNTESFDVESGNKILMRKQLPLILAWAITIHKAQGQTLTSAITDLSEAFDGAQIYVTLSRVYDLTGLFIININYNLIKCDPKVLEYYENLASGEPRFPEPLLLKTNVNPSGKT